MTSKIKCTETIILLQQEWGEKEEGGWRRRTETNDSEWRRPVADK